MWFVNQADPGAGLPRGHGRPAGAGWTHLTDPAIRAVASSRMSALVAKFSRA